MAAKALTPLKNLDKILVANRGEIAIRILRAASELRIRTVALYTYEDRYSLHRYKADEAYLIGEPDEPLKPYLDIEGILKLAKAKGVGAIHPGYGFLSENVNFARRCREEGILFVGPEPEVMERLGDKVAAKKIAKEAGVPIIEDNQITLDKAEDALQEAERIGYPVLLKAAAGGGGRGMRVIREKKEVENAFHEAKNEARNAFGDDTIFMEKYIDMPKHIEVQLMCDNWGNSVHLLERDCSVQRRFQKVVEVAPAPNLSRETKEQLYDYALRLARKSNYNNVGTVEFLVDKEENIYFIEVNPRIQVEHTITEEITRIDIVRSQILITKGHKLSDPQIFIKKQSDVVARGSAIQCRVTTEDPESNFRPDFGTINAYRNAAGFGIRLDGGSVYPGVTISPFFDSMLVKVSASGRTLKGACQRLHRALLEFRVRGVKTNIGFLANVISHPVFQAGKATVTFIDSTPELFDIPRRLNRGTKLLRYLANISVNGHPDVKYVDPNKHFRTPSVPVFDDAKRPMPGSKQLLDEQGPEKLAQWVKDKKEVLFTDTTFRDAHQSLLATRMRTVDILAVAESYAHHHPQTFSMEMWGGATFDVCLRFLKEDPWTRLRLIREAMPNILMQMLLRGSNAVGYAAYPDNLIEKFVEEAWKGGIDVFRIFDSLNWLEAMKVSIRAVRERTNAVAEASICYTGDFLTQPDTKYSLQYYLDLARQLEDEGAHILNIKDMAGLLKPETASVLIAELKKAVDIPIHLHTHDTSGIQSSTYMKAIEQGVDIVDCAISSMSGLTSQPSLNSMVAMMRGHKRENPYNLDSLNQFSTYWEDIREYYYPFETELRAGTAEVYKHEIPGGQYSNLRPQARSLGLEEQFETVKKNYAIANKLFGNIIKVTPSSKVVGDFALFMTSQNLTEEDIMERGDQLSFPESVKSFFRGDIGQPHGGFPKKLQKMVLKREKPYTDRPNAHLEPVDFDKEFAEFQTKFSEYCTIQDFLSYKLYPKVFEEFYAHYQRYGSVMYIPTKSFFYGLKDNEEVLVDIAEGKTIMVRQLYKSDFTDEDGMRSVTFEMNGQLRRIPVNDEGFESSTQKNEKVSDESKQVGSPSQGKISEIKVKEGQNVEENAPLFVIEAMKMETITSAPFGGKVKRVAVEAGTIVEYNDLVIEFE